MEGRALHALTSYRSVKKYRSLCQQNITCLYATSPERCKRRSHIRKIHSFPALTIIIIRRSLENAGLRSGYPERHLRIFQAESEQLFRPISNLSCVEKKGPWCFAYWGGSGSYFTANGQALILQLNAPEL